MKNCFSGALIASISDTFWNKIRRFLGRFWHLGSCMPKEVSRYPHNCCRMAYLSLSGPNMDPSWLQVGSSWAHVGPPSWLQLGSSWAHVGPRSRCPATPGPTQDLPDPFPGASWPPKPLQDPKWTPKRPPRPPTWTQNPQLGAQNRGQRPGGWGVAYFIFIYIYIYIYIIYIYIYTLS